MGAGRKHRHPGAPASRQGFLTGSGRKSSLPAATPDGPVVGPAVGWRLRVDLLRTPEKGERANVRVRPLQPGLQIRHQRQPSHGPADQRPHAAILAPPHLDAGGFERTGRQGAHPLGSYVTVPIRPLQRRAQQSAPTLNVRRRPRMQHRRFLRSAAAGQTACAAQAASRPETSVTGSTSRETPEPVIGHASTPRRSRSRPPVACRWRTRSPRSGPLMPTATPSAPDRRRKRKNRRVLATAAPAPDPATRFDTGDIGQSRGTCRQRPSPWTNRLVHAHPTA